MGGSVQPGTLYVISTPIGNLEDVTQRAVRVLQEVDLIAAEDTRNTGILLKHLSIHQRLVSYHSHNEKKRVTFLIDSLRSGDSVGVVTDAGTPGISDPAYTIIKASIEEGIPVVPLPGATAFVPALVVSGLPTDRFVFDGFLPPKKGRKGRLEMLADEMRTIILYESPHRIEKTLKDLHEYLGNRSIALVREISKKFEEVLRGSLSEIREVVKKRNLKGEIVIVVAGAGKRKHTDEE